MTYRFAIAAGLNWTLGMQSREDAERIDLLLRGETNPPGQAYLVQAMRIEGSCGGGQLF